MNSVRYLLILLLSVALIACGGGGGGGGGGSNGGSSTDTPPPGDPDDTDETGGEDGGSDGGGDDTGNVPPFAIDEVALFSVGMGTAEVTLTLARLSADAFLALEGAGFTTLEADCVDAGDRTLTFTDMDASTDLSVGDQVELTFNNCSGSEVAGLANGTIWLELESITAPADPAVRTLVFSETLIDFVLSDDGQQTTIEGGFQLHFNDFGLSGDSLTVSVESGFLRYGFPSGDSVSLVAGSQLQKTLDLDADTYSFSFEQTLDTTLDGETFTLFADTFGTDVTVAGEFSGDLPGLPTVGAARFYVEDVGSQCLLTPGSDISHQAELATPLLRLSDSGDDCMTAAVATEEALVQWSGMVAGALFSDVDSFDLRN